MKMKKTPYIICSLLFFLLAFPIAYVTIKPITNFLIPNGVEVVTVSASSPINMWLLYTISLAVYFGAFPVLAFVLKSLGKTSAVIALSIVSGILSALVLRAHIHSGVEIVSEILPAHSFTLFLSQIHPEWIPLAGFVTTVVVTFVIKQRMKAQRTNPLSESPTSIRTG
jgi:Sec-independent protein secretion pathway component TatC